MSRIIGGVEIDRDPPGVPAAAALMSRAVVPRMRMPGRRVGMRPPFADQLAGFLGC